VGVTGTTALPNVNEIPHKAKKLTECDWAPRNTIYFDTYAAVVYEMGYRNRERVKTFPLLHGQEFLSVYFTRKH
jgi:hypothetical protein